MFRRHDVVGSLIMSPGSTGIKTKGCYRVEHIIYRLAFPLFIFLFVTCLVAACGATDVGLDCNWLRFVFNSMYVGHRSTASQEQLPWQWRWYTATARRCRADVSGQTVEYRHASCCVLRRETHLVRIVVNDFFIFTFFILPARIAVCRFLDFVRRTRNTSQWPRRSEGVKVHTSLLGAGHSDISGLVSYAVLCYHEQGTYHLGTWVLRWRC